MKQSLQIIGWAKALVVGAQLHAQRPCLLMAPGGWTLVTAEDVNGAEWIVGHDVAASGSPRGYVLVPLTTATP